MMDRSRSIDVIIVGAAHNSFSIAETSPRAQSKHKFYVMCPGLYSWDKIDTIAYITLRA